MSRADDDYNAEDHVYYNDDDGVVDAPGANRRWAHENRNNSIRKGAAFIVLAFAAYMTFGQTLAANIGLNTGGRVEFGQGMTQTTACSGNNQITLRPSASFSNASGAGTFYFSSVTISGIPTSCYGSKFILNAWDTATASPLDLFGNNQSDAVFLDNSGTFQGATGSNGMTVTTNSTTSVTLTFNTPIAVGSNTLKLTLQSTSNTAVNSSTCANYLATTSNTTITVSNGTCIVAFTASTNTFTAPSGVKSVQVLVVAGGGGGGGGAFGGGGGAGGLIYNAGFSTTPGSNYSITVGGGGTGGAALLGTTAGYTDNSGANGSNSVFGSLTAIGGGGGGGYTTTTAAFHTIVANSSGVTPFNATSKNSSGFDSSIGKTGGSGGGTNENSYYRAAGTSLQGNSGGTPILVTNASSAPYTKIAAGGGGGGAGAAGGDTTADHVAGAGGVGLQYSISGSAIYYAGGGGGGTESSYAGGAGAGGNGGGGNGGTSGNGSNGTANTGGGGGGAGIGGTNGAGGSGGSGVVIIRFNP